MTGHELPAKRSQTFLHWSEREAGGTIPVYFSEAYGGGNCAPFSKEKPGEDINTRE